MRPSVAGMFDSEIRIWRPDVSKNDLATEKRTYAQIADVGCKVNRSVTTNTLQDGGNATVGAMRWYGLPTIDVLPRDVCEIISGPDAGTTWEVGGTPVRPRNHHTQVDCFEWHGKLPTGDSA